jgi:membrane associated rhomboid family serine protease
VTDQIVLLLCASMVAMQVASTFLRKEQRLVAPYLGLLTADLALLAYAHATSAYRSLPAVLGMVASVVLVFGPRLLDRLEARARARDDLGAAARIAGFRQVIVPGRASARHRRQLLDFRAAREGRGGDVVRRMEEELRTVADPEAAMALREELVLVLFHQHRFADAVAEVDRHLRPLLRSRPLLLSYLVRAHGELQRFPEAIDALRQLEDVLERDPGAATVLLHARLTVLASFGAIGEVSRLLALAPAGRLPEPTRRFLRETATAHATDPRSVEEAATLSAVARRTALADGAKDVRRPRGPVTLGLVAINLAVFATLLTSPAEEGLLLVRAGALFRPAVLHGEWWRAFSAMFLHAGLFHLAVNMYGLYLLGRFAEEALSAPRYLIIYLLGGLGGAAATTWMGQGALSVGASGAIMGLLGALIVVLLLRRGAWPEAWRRTLLWNLVFLGALQIYIGFQVAMIDNAAHIGGMLAGGAAALLFAPGGLLGEGAVARAVVRATGAALVALALVAGYRAATTSIEQTLERLPTREVSVAGVGLTVPVYWEVDAAHGRVFDPYLDVEIAPKVEDGAIALRSPQTGSPQLGDLLERIRKSARLAP